jgi:outer membrane protein TolC
MYRVGEGRQTDVLRAQVEIARMTEDTIRMRTMRTGMGARLNALLDRAAASPVSSPALPAFPAAVPALDSLQDAAQGSRPMLRAGREEVQAASASARLARRELFPDLQLGLQYGQRGGEMGTERMGSLMVGATVPVFARSRQVRIREEMIAMREMAEADLAAMRADTRARVAEAYAGLTRARNLAMLYRNTVLPQAEATASSALAAYRVGGVDFMTLLDNRMIVNRYRQQLFRLEAEEGQSWAELEMLLGRQLFNVNAIVADGRLTGGVQ